MKSDDINNIANELFQSMHTDQTGVSMADVTNKKSPIHDLQTTF